MSVENIENLKNKDQNKKATFIIQIKFKRNSTWQGSIQWVEKNSSQQFRSALEMINLIDKTIQKDDDENVDWNDDENGKK